MSSTFWCQTPSRNLNPYASKTPKYFILPSYMELRQRFVKGWEFWEHPEDICLPNPVRDLQMERLSQVHSWTQCSCKHPWKMLRQSEESERMCWQEQWWPWCYYWLTGERMQNKRPPSLKQQMLLRPPVGTQSICHCGLIQWNLFWYLILNIIR